MIVSISIHQLDRNATTSTASPFPVAGTRINNKIIMQRSYFPKHRPDFLSPEHEVSLRGQKRNEGQ